MKTAQTLIILTLLALLLRLPFLFHHDLWFDEAVTIAISRLPTDLLLLAASFDNHPPLSYLLLHFWMQLSPSPLWLRSLSLIFSITTVPVTYLLAKTLFNRKIGLTAAFLTTLMPVQLYYAGETRFYSLLILESTLLFWLATSGVPFRTLPLREPKQFVSSLTTAILIAALLLTHYSSILVIALATYFHHKWHPQNWRRWFTAAATGLILASPWLIYTFSKLHPPPWAPNPLFSLAFLPVAATAGLTGIASPTILKTLPLLLLIPVISLTLLFLYLLTKAIQKSLKRPFFVIGSFALIAFTIVTIEQWSNRTVFFTPRLILPFTPILYTAIAKALAKRPFTRFSLYLLTATVATFTFLPPLRGPRLDKAIKLASDSPGPQVVHTAATTFYPAVAVESLTRHLYAGPPIFPSPLTSLIGGRPEPLSQATSPNITLLIDERNTDPHTQNAIKEQLKSSHTLMTQQSIDAILIQTYTLKPKL